MVPEKDIAPEAKTISKFHSSIIEALPILLEITASDEKMSQIETVFSFYLGRELDYNTYDDIAESLFELTGEEPANVLRILIANNDANLIEIDQVKKKRKLYEFLKRLVRTYGKLYQRARALKYYPNEWFSLNTEVVGDPRRGILFEITATLGGGGKVEIQCTPNGALLLIDHILDNIVRHGDIKVEDQEVERRLIEFLSREDFKKTERHFEDLKKLFERTTSLQE